MKMKSLFIVFALALSGYAIYDFLQSEERIVQQQSQDQVLPGVGAGDVKRILIRRPMGVLKLENTSSGFRLLEPVEDFAGYDEVERFFSQMSQMSLKPVETNGPVDWSLYGLDKPESEVSFDYLASGTNKTLTLQFGSERAIDGGHYVRKENVLYISGSDWTHFLLILANDLRSKTVLQTTEIEKVEFLKGGSRWTVSRATAGLSADAIESYFHELRHLKADKVLDFKKPSTRPEIKISIFSKASEASILLDFFKSESGYLISSSERNALFEISKEAVAKIDKSLLDFEDHGKPFVFDAQKVTRILFQKSKGEAPEKFLKINGSWQYDSENPHLVADEKKIDDFLNSIRALKAQSLSVKQAGPFVAKLVFQDENFNTVYEIEWSSGQSESESHYYFAKSSSFNSNFSIARKDWDDILNLKLYKE